MAFFIGIEVQKRRLGSLGALASTINIIVLDNPMTFHFSQFLDSALGQLVGCFLAMMVILLVRDNSQARTGRVLLNQFVSAAVSSLTTNTARRKENHLPALYQQLFLLLNKLKTLALKDGYKDNQKLGFKRTHYPWLYEIPAEFDGKIKTPGILLLALLSCLLLPAPSLGLTLAQKLVETFHMMDLNQLYTVLFCLWFLALGAIEYLVLRWVWRRWFSLER